MAEERYGLILVTGATGGGKSTTLAAMLDIINANRAVHVVTLEDPVQFVFPVKKATFNQRELGTDFDSFATGLRAALRRATEGTPASAGPCEEPASYAERSRPRALVCIADPAERDQVLAALKRSRAEADQTQGVLLESLRALGKAQSSRPTRSPAPRLSLAGPSPPAGTPPGGEWDGSPTLDRFVLDWAARR